MINFQSISNSLISKNIYSVGSKLHLEPKCTNSFENLMSWFLEKCLNGMSLLMKLVASATRFGVQLRTNKFLISKNIYP